MLILFNSISLCHSFIDSSILFLFFFHSEDWILFRIFSKKKKKSPNLHTVLSRWWRGWIQNDSHSLSLSFFFFLLLYNLSFSLMVISADNLHPIAHILYILCCRCIQTLCSCLCTTFWIERGTLRLHAEGVFFLLAKKKLLSACFLFRYCYILFHVHVLFLSHLSEAAKKLKTIYTEANKSSKKK